MRAKQRAILDRFLELITDISLSIVLTGSQTEETSREDSDIDLIIVTDTPDQSEEVQRTIAEFIVPSDRMFLDCKIYTRDEIIAIKSALEKLFLWSGLNKGRLLSGKDITNFVNWSPQIAVDSIWRCIQIVQEACDMLEAGVKFTGACFHVYSALTTAFFVERDVLNSPIPYATKIDYIRSCLGDEFSKARERYSWVVKHTKGAVTPQTLTVPISVDRKFSREDYVAMQKRATSIIIQFENLYRRLVNWSENQSM